MSSAKEKDKKKKKLKKAAAAKDKGNNAFAKGENEEALKHFTQAIELDPDNHVYYSNRSATYMKLEKYDEAISDAKRCIMIKPDFIKGYARQGSAYFAKGLFKEAIAAYQQGLSIDPNDKTLKEGLFVAQEEAEKTKIKEETEKKKTESKESKEEKKNDYVVGIDLGTTYSCVGVWRNDTVEIIPNSHGSRVTPSYVSFEPNGDRLVGQPAKSRQAQNPVNTIYDIKRIIGQRFTDYGVERDVRNFPFKVIEGTEGKPLVEIATESAKKHFTPESISAMVLSDLKQTAENYLGCPIRKAVITVPAYFNDSQRNATKAAGAIAGLEVLRIINEPTAAALSYGLDLNTVGGNNEKKTKKKKHLNVLIFDLGGGTFDVSILSIEGGIFEVKATGGDTHLGGEDFDNATVQFLLGEVKAGNCGDSSGQVCPIDPSSDLKAMKRLRKESEKAKRTLSVAQTADIFIPDFATNYHLKYKLTRQRFNELNKEYFNRCIDTVKHVLKDAKMKTEDIDEVVLVGGSTRIPKIQEMLQKFFNGKELCKSLNPDEAVAYGAAVQGAILNGTRSKSTENLLLMDVTPLSLGIETTGRVMSVIIPRNTPIPVVKTQTYTTEENYQTQVDVCVYEGERLKTEGNNLLGKFTISGIERAKRGEPQVDVSFSVDSDGILNVSAKDQKTGSQAEITIANRTQLSKDQLDKLVKEAEKYRQDDEARLKRVEARNELERVILEVQDTAKELEESDSKLSSILSDAARKVQEWLEENGDTAKPGEIAMKRRELERRIQSHRKD